MDKKNTMLLTVIAVATLLVAVVGATFAFFTAQNSADGTTTVETTTELVGAVTVNNPTENMHINLDAIHMAQQNEGSKYYATTGENAFATAWEMKPISQITVTGGESSTTYKCYYALNVTGSDVLETGDAEVKFEAVSNSQITNFEVLTGAIDGEGGTAIDLTQEYDLSTAQNYTVRFNVTGNIETTTSILNAGFEFNNLTQEQDHLKNENLTFTAEITGMVCEVVE